MKELCEKKSVIFTRLSPFPFETSIALPFQAGAQLESPSLYLESYFETMVKATVV